MKGTHQTALRKPLHQPVIHLPTQLKCRTQKYKFLKNPSVLEEWAPANFRINRMKIVSYLLQYSHKKKPYLKTRCFKQQSRPISYLLLKSLAPSKFLR